MQRFKRLSTDYYTMHDSTPVWSVWAGAINEDTVWTWAIRSTFRRVPQKSITGHADTLRKAKAAARKEFKRQRNRLKAREALRNKKYFELPIPCIRYTLNTSVESCGIKITIYEDEGFWHWWTLIYGNDNQIVISHKDWAKSPLAAKIAAKKKAVNLLAEVLDE